MQFADRLKNVETSAIRELFKLLGKPGIISFAGGFPDPALFDAEGIRIAAEAALTQHPGAVLQYGATEGWQPLREQLSLFMKAKGATVAPDGLIVTTGSQQALDLIGKTMISPGDKVIVEAPTFLATIQCFRLYGADIISAPIDAHGVQVDALEKLILEHKPKLVYLIPTFGNPSGAMLSLERRRRILEIAAETKTLIVEDDPYGELYFAKTAAETPPPSMLALSDNIPGSREWLAHCGSLSKVLSPGLRVGWMIAPPLLLANATMCKQFSDAHTSNLTQATAAHYLTMNRMEGALNIVRKTYAERAQVMAACLRKELGNAIVFNQPQGGMFFWTQLTEDRNASDFAKRAIDQLVAFVPGAPFFANNPDLSTLRLSFATADVAKIEEGVARLGKAL
jgi:2-aminoadipate transaminase